MAYVVIGSTLKGETSTHVSYLESHFLPITVFSTVSHMLFRHDLTSMVPYFRYFIFNCPLLATLSVILPDSDRL